MTAPFYVDESVTLHLGDCLDVLRDLPDASVDAVVTDPPYGLEFMGKEWDGADGFRRSLNPADAGRESVFGRTSRTSPEYRTESKASGEASARGGIRQADGRPSFLGGLNPKCLACDRWQRGSNPCRCDAPQWTQERLVRLHTFQEWCEAWSRECLRVLKPGGHMLAFGGSRTWHRLAAAVEDAGFEIRDSIAWLYGSGFPKSLDVSKAIDKGAGAERETALVPTKPANKPRGIPGDDPTTWKHGGWTDTSAPATDAARTWQGWGTALKPAFEPIVVGRKPLAGTVAGNVLAHGTGALNIDGCRVAGEVPTTVQGQASSAGTIYGADQRTLREFVPNGAGRWPTNVVLDGSQATELDAQTGVLTSGANPIRRSGDKFRDAYGDFKGQAECTPARGADSGGASRFFPTFRGESCSEPSASTGTSGGNGGRSSAAGRSGNALAAPGISDFPTFRYEAKAPTAERPRDGDTAHPTVKPLDLMRWLVRLVTPPGGLVLDPFLGSGTTAEACVLEHFRCIGIEREAAYLPLAVARLSKPLHVGFDFGASA